ncbi:NUDIX hydrolase [Paenibacillus bovis]|uniref:Phosphohydrolase n=1 Tax=Paenibacillus bovis TaxID=1616788 RepID=A0A172ZJU8_9BACL|nr:NUDIX hydrolase [Paenibacillus bovis]ANF97809.1 phosphohydrolase [Paenibacillus bovis]
MKRVDVAYCLINDPTHSKVLMVKNVDEAGDRWSLPGGAVEKGESLEQAAIREAKEETGLDVIVHGIVAINECVFSAKQEHVLFITFKSEICGGNQGIVRYDEISELVWMDLEKAEQLMPYYQDGLQKLIHGHGITYLNEGEK